MDQEHTNFYLKHLGRADWFPWSLPCWISTPWTFLCVQGSRHSPAQGRISAQGLRGVTFPAPAASTDSSGFETPIPSHCSQRDLAEHSLCELTARTCCCVTRDPHPNQSHPPKKRKGSRNIKTVCFHSHKHEKNNQKPEEDHQNILLSTTATIFTFKAQYLALQMISAKIVSW